MKTNPPVLDAGEGPSSGDQLRDPGPVERSAAVVLGRDPDLLGVHRHARRVERVHLVGAADPHQRVGYDQRLGGDLQVRLVGADRAGRGPERPEPFPHHLHLVGRSEEGGAAATLAGGALREHLERGTVGHHRDEVRCGVAQRGEPVTLVVAEDLAVQPPGHELGGAGAVVGDHVDDRVTRQQPGDLVQVGRSENAQLAMRAEHERSLRCARTVS